MKKNFYNTPELMIFVASEQDVLTLSVDGRIIDNDLELTGHSYAQGKITK